MSVVIYGRANCLYCDKAKQLVIDKKLEYTYIDIREAGLGKEELTKLVGKEVLTVPQIFKDDKYVGGYTELFELLKTKE